MNIFVPESYLRGMEEASFSFEKGVSDTSNKRIDNTLSDILLGRLSRLVLMGEKKNKVRRK